MSEPLFTQSDVDRLRDTIELEEFDRHFQQHSVFLSEIADRLQQWIDQQSAPTTMSSPVTTVHTYIPGRSDIRGYTIGLDGLKVFPLIDETDLTEG